MFFINFRGFEVFLHVFLGFLGRRQRRRGKKSELEQRGCKNLGNEFEGRQKKEGRQFCFCLGIYN